MLNKYNFDGLTDFHTMQGIRYKIKLQDKGPEVGSLVDEGISKPLGGSTLQNHIPRHPPCWQAEIYIFYELAARWLETCIYTDVNICIKRAHLMHKLPSEAMGPPNNHGTGHYGQIVIGRLQD